MNIFEMMRERYFLPPKPKLFEAFSGIGCQRLAFKRLGIEVEMVGISEVDKYAIQSYMAIHGETKNFGSITDIKGQDLPQIDVFTWSFPCTDLSKAGKQQGMSSETRSGLVYEVLRILHESTNKPKVLIMENVVDLVQSKFIQQFNEIQLELEQLGYVNYVETMNAKDFGVAQNRDRVFMVSILGDYYYEFPKPFKLEKRLKDYLEDEVDEKYYIKDFESLTDINENYGQLNGGKWEKLHDIGRRAYSYEFVSPTIHTMQGGNLEPKVVVPFGSYYTWPDNQGNINTQCNRAADEDGYALTVACAETGKVFEDKLRIRKLTPIECWRLMGIDDEDFHKAKASGVSNSQLYKQAGNGLVVDMFAALLSTMIDTQEVSIEMEETMTVQELIEILTWCDEDKPVRIAIGNKQVEIEKANEEDDCIVLVAS